jgi:hypothetical protein
MLDPAGVNDQFATDSDENLPTIIAHYEGSREKPNSQIYDSG